MLHQIKAKQFYTDLGLYKQCFVPQKIVEFKDFSRFLCDFQVLFKADLILKYFWRKPSKFKYFSSLCEPCFIFLLFLSLQKTFNVVVEKGHLNMTVPMSTQNSYLNWLKKILKENNNNFKTKSWHTSTYLR